MTTTLERFAEDYDGKPSARLPKGLAALLIDYENYGLGTLPRPIGNAVGDYVLGVTEVAPRVAARRVHCEEALKVATERRKAEDAEVAAKALRKGPDGFAALASIVATDVAADAAKALADAQRTEAAVNAATAGLLHHLGYLMATEYRDETLASLERAWAEYVNVNPTSSTTLGELHRLESVAEEARRIVLELLAVVERPTQEERAIRRAALRETEWLELPTLEAIRRKQAEARRPEEAKVAKAEAEAQALRDHYRETARANAVSRRGLGRAEQNSEASPEA